MFAEQLAVVPPFNPVQLQIHGSLPLTAVWFPELQRPVFGAEVNVPPSDEPQAPFTGSGVKVASTVQEAVVGLVVKMPPFKVPPQVPPTDTE